MTECTHKGRPGIEIDRIVALRSYQRGDVDRRTDVTTAGTLALTGTLRLSTLVRGIARRPRHAESWGLTLVEELRGDGRNIGDVLAAAVHLALLEELLQIRVRRPAYQKSLLVVPWCTARSRKCTIAMMRLRLLLELLLIFTVELLTLRHRVANRRDVSGCTLDTLVVATIQICHKLKLA